MKAIVFFTIVLIFLSYAGSFAQQPVRAAGRMAIPLVDYHQHLFSPEKAKTLYAPPLTAVELPTEFSRLLNERVSSWNKKEQLATVFTQDAMMLNTQDEDLPTWIRGHSVVAGELANYFANPYRITPVAYHQEAEAGYIAGYYTRGEGEAMRHFGHVFLSLRKNGAGHWLIAAETPTFPGPFSREPSTADQLIAQLDDAGIERAVVLSLAYQWGSPFNAGIVDEYDKVMAENDYIARETAKYPKRLVGFCSVNPLKDYAIRELRRCQKDLRLKGLKLHFGNSRVDIRDTNHLEKVRSVFRSANSFGMPVVVHLWTDPGYEKEGDQHARIFLERVLPDAPGITIQIAHLAGGGRSTQAALKVFADAIAAGDSRTRNLYFDVATSVRGQTAEGLRQDVAVLRRIGLKRILYGTDTAPPNPPARVSWAHFKGLMPLTDTEIRIIGGNIAPYLQ